MLICPLDWGLGHATRCVPVVRELIAQGHTVFLAGSGPSLELLRMEFPDLASFTIASYGIRYSTTMPFVLQMAMQIPNVVRAIADEHRQVAALVQQHGIDRIISDNRYGCYCESIPSALILHQLRLLLPNGYRWMSRLVNSRHARLVRRFTECWVPDFPDRRLSGALSDNPSIPHRFVGALSRIRPGTSVPQRQVLTLVSGPEPQRTLFEELVVRQLTGSQVTYAIVRGLPGKANDGSLHIYNHLPAAAMNELIDTSGIIISRSGYSTIMDLAAAGKKAVFVPTPGQTEQMYLAQELDRRKIAPMMQQHEFNLEVALKRLQTCTGFTVMERNDLLEKRIALFCK